MILLFIKYIIDKILLNFAFAIYFYINFTEDARLLLKFLLAFELGNILSYIISLFQ